MTLAPTQGKEAKLVVGGGDTEVLGVRSADPDRTWVSESVMHFQDESPSELLKHIDWTINASLTTDHADAGQAAIHSAFEAGTSLAFKLYPDADVTGTYYSSTCVVKDWREKLSADGILTTTCTLRPYLGAAMTLTSA